MPLGGVAPQRQLHQVTDARSDRRRRFTPHHAVFSTNRSKYNVELSGFSQTAENTIPPLIALFLRPYRLLCRVYRVPPTSCCSLLLTSSVDPPALMSGTAIGFYVPAHGGDAAPRPAVVGSTNHVICASHILIIHKICLLSLKPCFNDNVAHCYYNNGVQKNSGGI